MGKHADKVAGALKRRQAEIPSSGFYQIGVKQGFFRKPGSQNMKKGYRK